jgi:hypothetical protein
MLEKINPYNAGNQRAAISQSRAEWPPATADFMLELDDVVALSLRATAGRRQRRIALISLCVLCILCAVSLVVVWLRGESGLGFGLILLVFILTLCASLSPPMWRRTMRRACVKVHEDSLPRQQTVLLSSDWISTITPDSEGRHRWRAIQNISATPTHVFFFVNNAQAVVVPARAFFNDAEFHAFVTLARDFWTRTTGRSGEEGTTQ